MREKIMVGLSTMFITAGIIFLAAAFSSCGKAETIYINQVTERPTVRVAVYNVTTPRSMLRVTCGRGGALLSYLSPDEIDTVKSFVGDTLYGIYDGGDSRDSLITPRADTLWRIQ